MTHDDKLRHFTAEVMFNVMLYDLGRATNDDGEVCVVACLDEEPLEVLLDRVAACGGYATVFSRGKNGRVRAADIIDAQCAIDQGATPMTDGEEPNPAAPVGLFLDYLGTTPNGVIIPKRLGTRIEAASSSRPVDLQPV
ncbi:hypothetical protein [Actinomyces faecalis]|uniref:hypothetical protein n=1 Tax=Actinomyces faecalis TaxID=2722820 RepID=UPI0015580599|nr:hypothetical protein [Actinomyces faecalis]